MIVLVALLLLAGAMLAGIIIPPDTPACGRVIQGRPFRSRAWPYRLHWATAWSGVAPVGTVGDCKPIPGEPLPQVHMRRRLRCAYSDFCDPEAWDLPASQIGYFQRGKPADPDNPAAVVRAFAPAAPMILGNAEGDIGCELYDGPTSCSAKPHNYLRHVWAAIWRRRCSVDSGSGLWRPDPLRFGLVGLKPGNLPGEDFPDLPIEHYGIRHADLVIDSPYANSYQWMVLLPVEPIELHPWYDPEHPEHVPYHDDPDAPLKGPSNDTFTYEMPCYARQGENVGLNNRGFGDGVFAPAVPAGIKGIVAHSPGGTHLSVLENYRCGCPFPIEGCDDPYGTCFDVVENQWRYFEGRCAVRRIYWTADPLDRGWWIDYLHRIVGWFVQDAYWWRVTVPPRQRWNAWYKGLIDCRTNGDVDDAAFAAWITAQDSGFGVEYRPRYAACNDVLINCAGQPSSIGGADTYPPAAVQTACDHAWDDIPPPCLREGLGYSHWRFPNLAAMDCTFPRNNFPECGLYHEIERKKYTNATRTTSVIQHGWAKLIFQTNTPRMVVV